MNIKCGLCGREIVVADDLVDGQHILCPYCDGVSEYKKPTRIELPTNVKDLRNNIKPPVEVPTENRKPLHVIRKEVASTSQGTTAQQMVSQRLHMAEEHARFYEEMKEVEHRRKMREKASGILMLFAVVLCAAGAYWYVGHRNEQRHQSELAYMAEKNRLEAERVEYERREKALREATVNADREKRLTEEKNRNEGSMREDERRRAEREERQKEQDRIRAEQERMRAEREKTDEFRVVYRKASNLFEEGRFAFLQDIPANSIPGCVKGEFFYILPALNNREIVVCRSASNGLEAVFRIDDMGKWVELDTKTFQDSLRGQDYLMAYDGRVYFQSKRENARMAQISKTDVIDLRTEFFGDIMPEMERRRIKFKGLRFEIVFIPTNSTDVIVADVIDSGDRTGYFRTNSDKPTYSLEKVRESIENAFPMNETATSSKRKKFKRTVVFWDGEYIKKDASGVTYVPRVRSVSMKLGRNAENWSSLYSEAKEQERAEQQFNRRQVESGQVRKQKPLSLAEKVYAAKIDRIYNDGMLYLRVWAENDGNIIKRTPDAEPLAGASMKSNEFSNLSLDELDKKLADATIAELKQKLTDKQKEYIELKKKNPACVLKTNLENIRNLDYRMVGRADKRYYSCRQVTYVRSMFWCTKCKRNFSEGRHCDASQRSGPLWDEAIQKVPITTAINAQIDELLSEIESLEKELSAAKLRANK